MLKRRNAAGGASRDSADEWSGGNYSAVATYYMKFVPGADRRIACDIFCRGRSLIGVCTKRMLRSAGAEGGCQGEVGVACAMAAGGIGGGTGRFKMSRLSVPQEIGIATHLGMTCAPMGGLVQFLDERNAMGGVKAINACGFLFMRGSETKFRWIRD